MSNLWPGRKGPGIRYITDMPSEGWQKKPCRSLVILGSTGSIGRSALSIAQANPATIRVLGLACARSVNRLAEQAEQFRPDHLAVLDEESAANLKKLLPCGYTPHIHVGKEGYRTLASLPEADTVLSSQAGTAGLAGTLAAALAGKVICLANKESLVQAGDLLRLVCAKTKASILPVDSEHFALFDCLCGREDDAEALVLTASGGPFRGKSAEDLESVTPAQALKHPNWNMGAKITIDSATLMNKALELIEACQLYGLSPDRVQVLVHPQSIVHSLVLFKDGGLLGQFATPDMRLPIGNCLLWPKVEKSHIAPLSLARIGTLTFSEVDNAVFPAIELARKAMQVRSGMSIVLNAADEAAVEIFLEGKCSFPDITHSVAQAMENHLMEIRAGDKGRQTPFCLSETMLALEGEALADACWQMLETMDRLQQRTAAFVRDFLKA